MPLQPHPHPFLLLLCSLLTCMVLLLNFFLYILSAKFLLVDPWLSKCGPWDRNISIMGELLHQKHWVKAQQAVFYQTLAGKGGHLWASGRWYRHLSISSCLHTSDPTFVAQNWPCPEYLHNRNWKTLQIRAFYPGKHLLNIFQVTAASRWFWHTLKLENIFIDYILYPAREDESTLCFFRLLPRCSPDISFTFEFQIPGTGEGLPCVLTICLLLPQ